MKRIVILTCPKTENVCTGGGCFFALNSRTKAFAPYEGVEVEVLAFMKCSGCGQYILQRRPDVVHLGICCCHDAKEKELCPEIVAVCRIFEDHGISVVRGTHSVF